jgi:hypothetical protein
LPSFEFGTVHSKLKVVQYNNMNIVFPTV